jgi:hypothetical protein
VVKKGSPAFLCHYGALDSSNEIGKFETSNEAYSVPSFLGSPHCKKFGRRYSKTLRSSRINCQSKFLVSHNFNDYQTGLTWCHPAMLNLVFIVSLTDWASVTSFLDHDRLCSS